jgi:trk system potassium uptake protein TrkA
MRLAAQGQDVIVIDEVRESFLRLGAIIQARLSRFGPRFGSVATRGVQGADLVLALTRGDNRNLMVAQLTKYQFGAKRVVARLHDPIRAAKFRELGVETLCTTTVLEGLLEIYALRGEFPELPGEMSVSGDASALDA